MSAAVASLYDDHIRIQRSRADSALAHSGFDAMAIYAGRAPLQFLDDQPYPFKTNPHFKLWAPLRDAADCWIVYQPNRQLQLLFLQQPDYWYKPPAVPAAPWTRNFSIAVIEQPAQARSLLAPIKRCVFIGDWQEEFADWGFAARNPQGLLDRLHYPRAIKTAYELECLRSANAIAARGHMAARTAFLAGASEYEIHLDYLRATGQTDNELPYGNIVALNRNSAVLHYQHLDRQAPSPPRSFLIDAGAEAAGYACDVTRTYSAVADDFAVLIDSMQTLQQSLCSQVRAGVDYASIHLDAHRQIAALLRTADVISIAADEAVASGLSSVFFPHGVGHLLGLQVHDVAGFMVSADGKLKARPPGHPNLRLTRTLEPGFVVTIEPGLYFIDSLLAEARASSHASAINWQRVAHFQPYGGIRIEDDVACTQAEPENLTRPAFARVEETNW